MLAGLNKTGKGVCINNIKHAERFKCHIYWVVFFQCLVVNNIALWHNFLLVIITIYFCLKFCIAFIASHSLLGQYFTKVFSVLASKNKILNSPVKKQIPKYWANWALLCWHCEYQAFSLRKETISLYYGLHDNCLEVLFHNHMNRFESNHILTSYKYHFHI